MAQLCLSFQLDFSWCLAASGGDVMAQADLLRQVQRSWGGECGLEMSPAAAAAFDQQLLEHQGLAYTGPCDASCTACSGPGTSNCTSCPSRTVLDSGSCVQAPFNRPVVSREPLSEAEAAVILDGYTRGWTSAIAARASSYQYIDVSWYASSDLSRLLLEASRSQISLVLAGYALVLVVTVAYTSFDWNAAGRALRISRKPPGPLAGAVALVSLGLSLWAALGLIGMLSSISPVQVNPTSIQILPFLSLGTGINAFFVLGEYVTVAVQSAGPNWSIESVMGQAMGQGGLSIACSSLASVSGFLLAAVTPIPAIRDFGIQVAISLALNLLVNCTCTPAAQVLTLRRMARGQGDLLLDLISSCCRERHRCSEMAPADGLEAKKPLGEAAGTPEEPSAGHRLLLAVFTGRWPRALLVLLFAGLAGFATSGIPRVTPGLDLKDVVPSNSYLHSFATAYSAYFSTFAINIVTRGSSPGAPMDNPGLLGEAAVDLPLELVSRLAGRVDPDSAPTSVWPYLMDYTGQRYCSRNVCSNEIDWLSDPSSSLAAGDPGQDLCADLPATWANRSSICASRCSQHCPQGPTGAGCELDASRVRCFCPWRAIPGPNTSILSDFVDSTLQGQALRGSVSLEGGRLMATSMVLIATNLTDTTEEVRFLKDLRRVLGEPRFRGLRPFAYDDVLVAQTEQYVYIDMILWTSLSFCLGGTLVFLLPLLRVWWMGLVVAATVIITVLEALGLQSEPTVRAHLGPLRNSGRQSILPSMQATSASSSTPSPSSTSSAASAFRSSSSATLPGRTCRHRPGTGACGPPQPSTTCSPPPQQAP